LESHELQPRRWAPRIFAAVLALAFTALVVWLILIQANQGGRLRRLAEMQQRTKTPIPPYRGAIVAANGVPVACTTRVYSLYLDPALILSGQYPEWQVTPPTVDELAAGLTDESGCTSPASRALAAALGLHPQEIERLITENAERRFVWLQRRVDSPVRDAVMAIRVPVIHNGRMVRREIEGLGIVSEGRRDYPCGQLAWHVVGTVGADMQGTRGLEYLLDDRLAGTAGFRAAQVDGHSGRRPVWVRSEDYVPAVDGQTVVLTLDLNIQRFTEEALREVAATYKAKGASALVMDPKTGEVLALANYPTFDPAAIGEAGEYALRNRLLVDPIEPGSTMKSFIYAAAVEAGCVRPGETIYCHDGAYRIPGRTLRDVHPYGNLTAEMVVIKSSNIGMGIIGLRMGNQRLHEALKKYGFGDKTGILLPGESPGVVKPLDKWSTLTTTSVPMGYEVMVTPLQMVTAFCAIANGGNLMKPRIIKYVYGPDGQLVSDLSQPITVRQVFHRKTCDYLKKEVLRRVITEGTGKSANIEAVEVFGKTGTAMKIDHATGKYSTDRNIGAFIAAAPLADPRLAVMVVVDEPDRDIGHFGGTVAGPAVKQILEKSLAYMNATRVRTPVAPVVCDQVALQH
jgi:cell division protein FtsI/penicillin-binding protein 2